MLRRMHLQSVSQTVLSRQSTLSLVFSFPVLVASAIAIAVIIIMCCRVCLWANYPLQGHVKVDNTQQDPVFWDTVYIALTQWRQFTLRGVISTSFFTDGELKSLTKRIQPVTVE